MSRGRRVVNNDHSLLLMQASLTRHLEILHRVTAVNRHSPTGMDEIRIWK